MAIFLKLEGIDGECEKSGHEKWIEVLSWSWGANNPASAQHGTGLSAGTVSVQDISVQCVSGGKASLLLLYYLTVGKHMKELTLDVTKATSENTEGTWLQLTSTSAMITSVQAGGTGEDPSPIDSISIAFGNYKQEIWSQETEGGALKTQGTHGFDIKTKTAT